MASEKKDVSLSATFRVEKKKETKLDLVPEKVGKFTVEKKDGERIFHDNESELRILKLPSSMDNVNYNLIDGYKSLSDGGKNYAIMPDNCLNEMLEWVILNRENLDQEGESEDERPVNIDFVSSRGTLSRIMLLPYETYDDLLIGATLFKGTIYLHRHSTAKMKREEAEATDERNMFSYGGQRFEEYITTPAFPEQAQETESAAVHHEYYNVIKTNVNKFSLIFDAEMDCIKQNADPENVELSDFVEIKTTNAMKDQNDRKKFHKLKSIKWWVQNYLTGTPRVLCGHREGHKVKKLEFFDVKSLPAKALFWDHEVCIDSLHRFFKHLKSVVTEDDHECVYLFSWKPPHFKDVDRGIVTCKKTYSDQYRVVTDSFAEKINLLSA